MRSKSDYAVRCSMHDHFKGGWDMQPVDTSKPNSGRIYDYLLGGNHNFEVDRRAAQHLQQLMPSLRNAMRLNRWFLHEAVHQLAQRGFNCYLDLASGLPTQGYIHEIAPAAKVIYSDSDPVTVAYAHDILGTNANVRYMQVDVSQIQTLLAGASDFFADERLIATCFIGIAYMMSDLAIKNILGQLYNWCASGSQVAISWAIGDIYHPRVQQIHGIYRQMGTELYLRSRDNVEKLIERWHITAPGLQPLSQWLDLDPAWQVAGSGDEEMMNMYGIIIEKP